MSMNYIDRLNHSNNTNIQRVTELYKPHEQRLAECLKIHASESLVITAIQGIIVVTKLKHIIVKYSH